MRELEKAHELFAYWPYGQAWFAPTVTKGRTLAIAQSWGGVLRGAPVGRFLAGYEAAHIAGLKSAKKLAVWGLSGKYPPLESFAEAGSDLQGCASVLAEDTSEVFARVRDVWPRSPGSTFLWFAGDSATALAADFVLKVYETCLFATGVSKTNEDAFSDTFWMWMAQPWQRCSFGWVTNFLKDVNSAEAGENAYAVMTSVLPALAALPPKDLGLSASVIERDARALESRIRWEADQAARRLATGETPERAHGAAVLHAPQRIKSQAARAATTAEKTGTGAPKKPRKAKKTLTAKDAERIPELMRDGKTARQITNELGVSDKTVERNRLWKLGRDQIRARRAETRRGTKLDGVADAADEDRETET